MEKEVFKFHVQNLAFGWCCVLMNINDKEICYNAEYLGPNPLETFINACAYLMEEGNDYYHTKWMYHDDVLDIKMTLDEKGMLLFDIIELTDDHDDKSVFQEYHEVVEFKAFQSAMVSEGFRVLNAFGLYGYQRSWQNYEDFPLTNLLRITGECKEFWKGDSCSTDVSKEIEVLQKHISKLVITEETELDEGTIYYESWQIQCCGDPFSVGDKVDWTCIMPSGYKNAHGIITDFEENHHGFSTHSISGTVTKIIVERSEFPKGQREAWYDKAEVIHEEISHADGWESEYKDDDTTDRTFWGYIVELKDVIVKPLK